MGLDTSHDCWHGAYSRFTRFRHALAEAAGYAVWDVVYQGSYGPSKCVMLDWGHVTEANLQGEWDKTPADPLVVLIAHSDCDGRIHPQQGILLADRMEQLLPLLSNDPMAGWQDYCQKFIAGLRAAAAANEPVEFH